MQQCKEKKCIQTPHSLRKENRLLSSLNKSLSNVFTAGQIQSSLYYANHKSVSWEMAMLCTQHYPVPSPSNYTTKAMRRQERGLRETYTFLDTAPDTSFTLLNYFQLQKLLKVLWSTLLPTEENKYLIKKFPLIPLMLQATEIHMLLTSRK